MEEIQSDMHQPISAALRKMRKLEAQGDTTSNAYKNSTEGVTLRAKKGRGGRDGEFGADGEHTKAD